MLGKGALFSVATILITIQAIESKEKYGPKVIFNEYVDVNGTDLYISTALKSRDSAKIDCQSRNMSLISFDRSGEWQSVSSWILGSAFVKDWFWTSGLRPSGSQTWQWELTGEGIGEFFWAAGQPTEADKTTSICINFNVNFGGWDDDECVNYSLGHICEPL